MNNKSVINAFVNGKNGRSSNGNLRTDGTKLFNYGTCIAQKLENGTILLNKTKYSVSTSKIQTWAAYIIPNGIDVHNVPMGAKSLIQYLK